MSYSTAALASALVLLSQSVNAHIGIWHPSVYGVNASGIDPANWFDTPVNTNFIKNPLRKMDNLKFDQWWFHGLRGATPDAVMELPAGETITIQTSCNKAWTSYGLVPEQKALIGDMPCDVNVVNGHATYGDPNVPATNGPMHVADKSDAKGCGLAIAYTDDVYSIKPEDFTVFSVNHTCVWTMNTQFQIPADMPPCPDGKKCICSWNWIHGADRQEGYGNELYMIGFDCTVTKSKSNTPIAKPQLPVSCVDDPSKCVKGAKQALYWQGAQAEGWNIPDTGTQNNPMTPPFYNMDYGFADGAQNDIFGDSGSSPVALANNRVAVSNYSSSSTSSSSSDIPTGIERQAIYTSTIVSTRYHVETVTAQATPARMAKRVLGQHGGGKMKVQHRRNRDRL